MHLLPVIQRELRVASRQRATWRLRLVFATAALLACIVGVLWPDVPPRARGQAVLICVGIGSFCLALFAGAYLTADSISGEKRDGTLGLLFLTPLNGWQIVTGKMVIHSLQAGTAWLATFPVFFLPVLQGGVTSAEVSRLLLASLVTLLLSLACGMFWSSISLEARTSVLGTGGTMLALNFLPWLPMFVRGAFLNRGFRYDAFAAFSPMTLIVQAFDDNYGSAGRAGVGSGPFVYWSAIGATLALGLALVAIAGWLLPWLWRRAESGEPVRGRRRAVGRRLGRGQRPEGRWAEAAQALPCRWLAARGLAEPRWLRRFRRTIWLGFGWMLFISAATRHWEEGFITAFCIAYGLHLMGRVQAALTVTRRVHEDRRSGALELLLVSPVTDWEVVEGHHHAQRRALRGVLRGLVGMSLALQAMVVLFPKQLHMTGGEWAIFSVFFTGGALLTVADFGTLRWLGLREALRGATHLKAAARAFGTLMVPPWLAFVVTFLMAVQTREEEVAAMIFAAWVVASLLYAGVLVRRSRAWLATGLRRRVAAGD